MMVLMGWRAWSWLLLVLALLGCSFQDVSSEANSTPVSEYFFGGQTGSLVPRCGVAPLSESGRGIPEGDVVAVLYTADCPGFANRVSVASATGDSVSVFAEPLSAPNVYVIRSTRTLTAGEYAVTLADGEPTLISVAGFPELRAAPATSDEDAGTVLVPADAGTRASTAPSGLPVSIGELRQLSTESCDPEFELTLSPDAAAYAALLRLEVSVNGGPLSPWSDYGTLQLEGDRARLQLPQCSGACLAAGMHRIELIASIAGEEQRPDPIDQRFSVACEAPSRSDAAPEQNAGCALAPEGHGGPPSQLAALALLLLICAGRRNRRRAAEQAAPELVPRPIEEPATQEHRDPWERAGRAL